MKSRSSQILGIVSFPMSIRSFPHKVKGFPKFPHEGLGFPPQGLSVVKTVHTWIYSRLVVQGTSCSKSSALWKVSLSVTGLSQAQQVNQLGIENLLTLYKKAVSLIRNHLISDSWLLISTAEFQIMLHRGASRQVEGFRGGSVCPQSTLYNHDNRSVPDNHPGENTWWATSGTMKYTFLSLFSTFS